MNFHIGLYHEFDREQKKIIYEAKNIDFKNYGNILNPKFTVEQMRLLTKGLESGIDISKFNDPEYTMPQMRQIIIAYKIEKNQYFSLNKKKKKNTQLTKKNIEKYLLNKNLTANQMSSIIDTMLFSKTKDEFKENIAKFNLKQKEEEEMELEEDGQIL